MVFHHSSLLILVVVLFGCAKSRKVETTQPHNQLKYATGFAIDQLGSVKKIEVTTPYHNAATSFTYFLAPEGAIVPDSLQGDIIRTPVKRMVCTSTSHIPLLDYLDETETLVGFPTTDYISSPAMRAHIESGAVVDLGVDKSMNVELITTLQPDMIMAYSVTGNMGQLKKLKELGNKVVINAEYLEPHPLGRAEWIKFMACFFEKETMADSIFNAIEANYQKTKSLVGENTQPTVMSGIVYGDTWFMPAGQNYAAKLLGDAGYRYLWSDNSSTGFLELSFESVFIRAQAADYWIGVGSFETLDQMKTADPRYAGFKAFQQGRVYTYNARIGPKGGSEFLELGYLRPDIILKDLVKIAHPGLLPGYTPYFHKKLKIR
ncbi:MAG: ABC transporter substrate-binding protein [Cyclobacteriaceae bacterium]